MVPNLDPPTVPNLGPPLSRGPSRKLFNFIKIYFYLYNYFYNFLFNYYLIIYLLFIIIFLNKNVAQIARERRVRFGTKFRTRFGHKGYMYPVGGVFVARRDTSIPSQTTKNTLH